MVLSERELGFSDDSSLDVHDVIILNDSQIFVLVFFIFVADTDKHETVSCCFPHCIQSALNVRKVVRKTDFLFESVRFVADRFSFFVFSQIVGSEVPFLVMSDFEPSHHWMMVGLLDYVLVCPFSVFGIEDIERLIILF